MKFNRVVGELILVAGAIAGIVTVISAQRPTQSSQTPTPAVIQSAKAQSNRPDSLAWLGNLVGVAQFVKTPTEYRFIFEEELGQITAASLKENIMTISFRYPTAGEVRTGELTGTVDSDGRFVGTYQTQSQAGLEKGDITLSFVADGTAKGNYENGTAATRIFL